MKKVLISVVFLGLLLGTASAQQFAKAGLVNLSRIYAQFYKESKGVKEFEDLKASIQKTIDGMKNEIRQLNEQKLDAQSKGDQNRANQLDQEMARKQDAMKEFGRVKQEELRVKSEEIKSSTTFQKMLITEIEKEAQSKGFSTILNIDNPAIIWYSPDVDITEGVIARLTVDFAQ